MEAAAESKKKQMKFISVFIIFIVVDMERLRYYIYIAKRKEGLVGWTSLCVREDESAIYLPQFC